jgi:CelD/BcsL family acetyltransferase involved in cellulose biosynthesis
VRDLEAFRALEQEWRELMSSSGRACLFLTWEWLFTWWKHLGGKQRLAILVVRRGDQLLAVAPLAQSRSWRSLLASSLRWLGTGSVGSDYLDVLVREGEEEAALGVLADHLGRALPQLDLGQLEHGGTAAAALARMLERRGWGVLEHTTNVCPFVDLSGRTWDSYVTSLGSSHRQNLRRRLRKLESTFAVRLERVRSADRLDAAIDVLIALHHNRWRGRGGSDAFDCPEVLAFHREISRLALARGWLRLFVLHLDEKPAAALYGFRFGDRFLYYQSGFDARYADYSVGMVMMALAIRSAIDEGVREYDLLHGAEPYKFHWATGVRELVRLEIYPPSPEAVLRRQVRRLSRRLKEQARGWLGGSSLRVRRENLP